MQGVVPGAGWEGLEARVERNTHELLDILAAVGARSTFFVLGWVARRYPGIVRRIVDEGHELASHTDMHKHLSSLPARELQEELLRSRESLEQAGATRVRGVRAPNFSVNDQVVERMAEAGYWYDSSYFSVGAHRAYGRLSGDLDPDGAVIQLRSGLLELPMSRLRLGRMALP